tara:strand:+ start:216 stop:1034 length:819 start_codon:yes stop_codon:yes gene_type:complete
MSIERKARFITSSPGTEYTLSESSKRGLSPAIAKAREITFKHLMADRDSSDKQLENLFKNATSSLKNLKFIPGPQKGAKRAQEKTREDYNGDFYELKDLVRMTVVVPDARCNFGACRSKVLSVREALVSYCKSSNGCAVIKDEEIEPKKDPCGYSGFNFVARLPNGRLGEIQINTPNILFGKMSEDDFVKDLGQELHSLLKLKYHQIDCGMGHALYKIYRESGGQKKKNAETLSSDYYKFLRSDVPSLQIGKKLKEKLKEFRQKNRLHFIAQ